MFENLPRHALLDPVETVRDMRVHSDEAAGLLEADARCCIEATTGSIILIPRCSPVSVPL